MYNYVKSFIRKEPWGKVSNFKQVKKGLDIGHVKEVGKICVWYTSKSLMITFCKELPSSDVLK